MSRPRTANTLPPCSLTLPISGLKAMHPRAGRTLAVTLSQFAEAHASYSYLRMHEAKRLVYAVRRSAPELLSEALARPPAAASGRNGRSCSAPVSLDKSAAAALLSVA